MLSVENIFFSYGNQQVLQNVSLQIRAGEIVGLIGENGAGKSTLMKVMCGLRSPDKGNVIQKSERIGALIEEPSLYKSMTVQQNIDFFRKLYGEAKDKADSIMEITGINKYLKKKVGKLSMGMKKRVGIAVALLASDKVVLLDEPTNGLDPSGIRDMLSLIKDLSESRGTSFLISSHIFADLESVCDTYYKLGETQLKNVYDNEGVYGYVAVYEGMSDSMASDILNRHGISYKIEDKKIYAKYNIAFNKAVEKIGNLGIKLERRKLSEVYFE